ncbi:1,6-anhydro-N-acetylmuramyl-L-alanine amidase AmpD [BD1-7 clade bacterium]|uniref:1,6-anhydro-N-acetylmuramyl-L-alanine amidase AmpD n=1 Tax=BD1-7 clade bacterium TaxID=2029982 RepID=A0A5S9N3N0_9GAMM|nr:1,6-anhydro-N-acetylmuramyl-L-alanine amidase AmpD [BD1-7 clade bacterium]
MSSDLNKPASLIGTSPDIRIAQFEDGWLVGAAHQRSPFYNDRPQSNAGCVSLIVVHNISLPHRQFGTGYVDQLFLGQLDCSAHASFADLVGVEVSSHFLIRRSGEVCQFVSADKRAWHAGVSEYVGRDNCNDFSIGIELEGADDVPYEPPQYQQLAVLCAALMGEYPSIEPGAVTGHSDIAPGRKTDPGPVFDWSYFRQLLATELGIKSEG